jgi:hypothetical protein
MPLAGMHNRNVSSCYGMIECLVYILKGYMKCEQGKIKSLEQIYLFSLPVKEYQIVESFLGSALKDEVMKIMPVQKQTRAGQRTRFKVIAQVVEVISLDHCSVGFHVIGIGFTFR